MPWCDDCSRFWNPSSMSGGGACPSCGRVLAPVTSRQPTEAVPYTPPPGQEVSTKVPWHFWILVVAVVAYLAWRIVQMIGWLFD